MAASKSGRFPITQTVDASDPVRASAEHTVREAYGRILALLVAGGSPIASAEDALSDALAQALDRWPENGVPDKPEAWLLTTARHCLIDQARRTKTAAHHEPHLIQMIEEAEQRMQVQTEFPDERLKLLFVCAHPDIDPALQTPLMLQTVMGLNAQRIASAYLVQPSTMSQRLVRLKQSLKGSDIAFAIPERDQWASRLNAVLQAIYGAYNAGWDDHENASLADEARYLAELVCSLLPYEAEAAGLLSLILHCEARRPARRDKDERFIPLSEQDHALWDDGMIAMAERCLGLALRMGAIGRFQLEAALQSVHAARKVTGQTDWPAILAIYERLLTINPTLGARVGQAAAIGQGFAPKQGLAALAELPHDSVEHYQPYWATRAHLESKSGNIAEARDAYDIAIGLTADRSVREYLLMQLAKLGET